jgi:hypothetical protein
MKKIGGAALAFAILAHLTPFALSSCRDARLRANDQAAYGAMCSLHNAKFEAFSGGSAPADWHDAAASLFRHTGNPRLAEAATTSGRISSTPYHGYYFRAVEPNPPGTPIDERGWLAIYAYPAVYGKTGLKTYFINGSGFLAKDVGGACPDRPLRDEDRRQGWNLID